MVILAMLVVYAVAKLISLVANVIHVRLDISTFLHAKVKLLIHIHYSYCISSTISTFKNQIPACACNTQGSYGTSCNADGICSCKANIIGSKCDSCAAGYFNFSTCQGKVYLISYLHILH